MDILSYRKSKDLTQAAIAQMFVAAGYQATQSLVSQWENGDVVLSADRALQWEIVTGGEVKRADVRPDLFGEIALSGEAA